MYKAQFLLGFAAVLVLQVTALPVGQSCQRIKNGTASACELQRVNIECPTNSYVGILKATYGAAPLGECNNNADNWCRNFNDVTSKTLTSCDQTKNTCSIGADNIFASPDPCPLQAKKLIIDYECCDSSPPIPAPARVSSNAAAVLSASGPQNGTGAGNCKSVQKDTVKVCEGQAVTIDCPRSSYVAISRATYGAAPLGQCNNNAQNQCLEFNDVTTKAAQNCNQEKNFCAIPGDNFFASPDPCPFQGKQLIIDYDCCDSTPPAPPARVSSSSSHDQ